MLVLSRRKNEEIVIGEHISIIIVDVRGGKVRVGIEAPAEVPVHRREVKDAIDAGPGGADRRTTIHWRP